MEREFYLLVISLSLLHHEVVTHKANFCNITETYFVEVAKTETVLEFKKPSGFHLLGMFSNSNKYENISKTVIGVEKRQRIVEECCSGYKRKGDKCVSVNEEKSVPKSTTIGSTTITTLIAPNVAATEVTAKPVPDSSTAEPPAVTESKVLKPVIELSSPTEPKLPESVSTESPSTEAKAPDSSPVEPTPELSSESSPQYKPKDLATESPSPEPSLPEPSSPEPVAGVATEAKAESTTIEPSLPSTESKTPESVSPETFSEPAPSAEPVPPSEPAPPSEPTPSPEPTPTSESTPSPEPAPSPEPIPPAEPAPSPEPTPPSEPAPSPEPTPTSEPAPSSEPAPTQPKAPESVPSEASPEPASKASKSEPTESPLELSSTPTPTESKAELAEPVILSTPPTQTNSPTPTDSSSTPVHPMNADLIDELVVDPTAVDTDQTTIINGRKRRSIIDIPSNSLDLDSNTESEIDLEFSLNDELYSRKEHHEIVVSDIEDDQDDTTWIEVLELLSFGAVVFLLVITIQASYDGEAVSSLWKSKNKDYNIDSYGEYWIYDSQGSLEEV